jgi:hypothetical protein
MTERHPAFGDPERALRRLLLRPDGVSHCHGKHRTAHYRRHARDEAAGVGPGGQVRSMDGRAPLGGWAVFGRPFLIPTSPLVQRFHETGQLRELPFIPLDVVGRDRFCAMGGDHGRASEGVGDFDR